MLGSPKRNSCTLLPSNTESMGYLETLVTTSQTRLTFQIGEDLIYTAAEV